MKKYVTCILISLIGLMLVNSNFFTSQIVPEIAVNQVNDDFTNYVGMSAANGGLQNVLTLILIVILFICLYKVSKKIISR